MSKIQITCETSDAQIYYSTDGSDPSNLYSEPFELNEEATIKAIGKKEGCIESNLSSFIAQKLPNVEVSSMYGEGPGFPIITYHISNTEDYPENSYMIYKAWISSRGETEENEDWRKVILSNDPIAGYNGGGNDSGVNFKVYVSCEGYLDSDIYSY